VQELIGQVGPNTKAVEKVLREIGFTYAHRIDPFDGGPHFQARTDDITLVRATRTARVADTADIAVAPAPSDVAAIVARERSEAPYFVAVRTLVPAQDPEGGTLPLSPEARAALQVAPGDEIAYLRLH
jgi:arginine N-succinyltransferase